MKTYSCIITITSYYGDSFSDELLLTEDKLEFLNNIAFSLPYEIGDYRSVALNVILLPNPKPADIAGWYYNTSNSNMEYIICRDDPEVYEKFKERNKDHV